MGRLLQKSTEGPASSTPSTSTKLYDRRQERVSLDEVERIRLDYQFAVERSQSLSLTRYRCPRARSTLASRAANIVATNACASSYGFGFLHTAKQSEAAVAALLWRGAAVLQEAPDRGQRRADRQRPPSVLRHAGASLCPLADPLRHRAPPYEGPTPADERRCGALQWNGTRRVLSRRSPGDALRAGAAAPASFQAGEGVADGVAALPWGQHREGDRAACLSSDGNHNLPQARR